MRRIAQISDLHFGRTDPAVVDGLVAELNAEPPDLIIISGDFTMAARRSEYAEAQRFVQRLPKPWIAVPGNHDISPYHLAQRFFRPFSRYKRAIAPDTEPTFLDDEIGVVCINTVRTWAPERDWSQGKIHRWQIIRSKMRFDAMPDGVFRIVVGHHPFAPPPWDEEARIVGRADIALDTFRRCGVGLALAGHLHRHYVRVIENADVEAAKVDHTAVEGRKGHLLCVQAGSATSTRLRGNEPNAYNRIIVENGVARIVVRLWNGTRWEDAAA